MKKKDLERRLTIIEEKLGIVNETLKLEVGRWYKYPEYEDWKLCITSIDGNEVGGYGVDLVGGWMKSGNWGVTEDELDKLIECTPQEIKESLEKEAKRRYKVGDKVECLVSRMSSMITEPPYVSTGYSVKAGTDCLASGYIYLFQNGNWAEVLEKSVDKPDEPKAGSVCKFWDNDEDSFVVATLSRINPLGDSYPYEVLSTDSYRNAKSLTKQEAIKLLFGDEQD